MKPHSCFWVLLRNQCMLANFGRPHPVMGLLILYTVAVSSLPLVMLFDKNNAHGNIAALFEANLLTVVGFLFLLCLSVWMAHATIPSAHGLHSNASQNGHDLVRPHPLEFIFSRATDRRILFRARSSVFFLIVLTPLFVSLAISSFLPDLSFHSIDGSSPARQIHYLETFDGSRILPSGELIIPGGASSYISWLAWAAIASFFALQAYGTWIAKFINPTNIWHWTLAALPLILLLFIAIAWSRNSSVDSNFYESSFLFFSGHRLAMALVLVVFAIVVQLSCEKRFSKLEIL